VISSIGLELISQRFFIAASKPCMLIRRLRGNGKEAHPQKVKIPVSMYSK